ncbi:MAG TPA: hypothetical protein VJ046_00140 [Candidatus Paceibacterota bacterium]|nr:hypothetical protein [Candidatus Paceibacterota bacterium]
MGFLSWLFIKSRAFKPEKFIPEENETQSPELERMTRELLNSPYPTPNCVMPWEKEYRLKHKKWPRENVAAHVESCLACRFFTEGIEG